MVGGVGYGVVVAAAAFAVAFGENDTSARRLDVVVVAGDVAAAVGAVAEHHRPTRLTSSNPPQAVQRAVRAVPCP